MKAALAALPLDVQDDIMRLTVAESAKASGPITCPMLDRSRGSCLVYAARPIACRTYGFYTERDAGLHCSDVSRAVEANEASVVWGNGEGIASDMQSFGPTAPLSEWMSREA